MKQKEELISGQVDMLDFGANDQFDCAKCVWFKTYGYCYPKVKLGRQYLVKVRGQRLCSDYATMFASKAEKTAPVEGEPKSARHPGR